MEKPAEYKTPTLNIKTVKQHGIKSGLEAELEVQVNMLDQRIKERNWSSAATFAMNCKALLDELHFINLGDEQPCVLTSSDPR